MAIFSSSFADNAFPYAQFTAPDVTAGEPGGVFLPASFAARNSGDQRFIRRSPDYSQGRPQRGECFKQFGDLFWFENVHIIPREINLGTVLSTQEREYEIFNGYRASNRTLSSITRTGDNGFTITGDLDESPGQVLGPKETVVVGVSVSPIGPITIEAEFVYTFVTGEVLRVSFTGTRVIIAATEPQSEIEEVWEWQTDIIEAGSGDEQRISSRDIPRQSFRYRFRKEDAGIQRLRNQLWGWGPNTWALPIWTDYTKLSADAAAGVTSLSVESTSERDFRSGSGELALIWADEETFEAVEVSALTSNSLTLARATLASYDEGSLVIPVRLAVLRNNWTANQPNFGARDADVQWQVKENVDWADALSPRAIEAGGVYRDLPVWDILSDYLITDGSFREAEDFDLRVAADDGVGKFIVSTPRKFPQNRVTGISLEAFGRSEFFRMRSFLHGLRGRQKAIWVSTGRHDFTIESTTSVPTTEINVEPCDYTALVFSAPDGPRTRRNIEIVYADGSVDRRRIVTAQETAGVREVLTVDATLSQECSAANVERVSFLIKRRLDTDRVAFRHSWYEGEVATAPFGLVDVYDGE